MAAITLDELRKADGSSYVIPSLPQPACEKGEFVIAATGLEHGHINGMCSELCKAGAVLKWVYDRDPQKQAKLLEKYPDAKAARCVEEILDDPAVHLVAAADIPNLRGPLGLQVMAAGKDYFTDKTPFTSLEQLAEARYAVRETGRKYMVYYGERLCCECAMLAGDIIEQGAIGEVLQVIGLGPHRLGPPSARPDWFFKKEQYGGILCDIGSHQCEQFLSFTGAKDAQINFARVANFGHPEFPELEDFGEASLTGDNGKSFYFRIDWFTPDGLRSWGDGRTMILGSEGTIELRKYVDIGNDRPGNQLYLFDKKQEVRLDAKGSVGHRFFSQFIRDCLNRSEDAMSQEHAFKAAELCMRAQQFADNQ
jgi:predicted dehydrogenase